MTESSDGATSWWSSWVETAKNKSHQTMEFMRRDITEFTDTIQQDTASVVSSTAAVLREKLNVETGSTALEKAKEGISSLLGSLTESLAGPNLESDEGEMIMIKNSEPILLDRSQAEIYAIQTNPETFCHEPSGPPEMYEEWLMTFKIDDHQDDLSDLMIHQTEMRNLYSQLVPSAVSHDEFWHRYYYRLHQFEEAEKRRAALVQRADKGDDAEVSFEWDNVEDDCAIKNAEESGSPKPGESNEDSQKIEKSIDSNESCKKDIKQCTDNEEPVSEPKKVAEDFANKENESVPSPTVGSSECSSKESSFAEDWEKNFDLDMTEEELAKANESGKDVKENNPNANSELGDDWETWE